MGFFSSKKVFYNSTQIRKTLFKIASLDYKERATVFEKFKKELDDGGVTAEEIREAVRQMRLKKEISEIDKNNLLKLIK